MRLAPTLSVASLGLCGLVGGCLILALDGFTSSGKRGESPVFVPAPQAYVMAAIMFALSVLALVWVLQQARASKLAYGAAVVFYAAAVVAMTRLLGAVLV